MLKYARIAISVIGWLYTPPGVDAPSKDPVLLPVGGVCGFDVGLDELLSESPLSVPFPSLQVSKWGLDGMDYCSHKEGKVNAMEFTVSPQEPLANRGGSITISWQLLSYEFCEYEGLGLVHRGETVDSYGSLLALPNARTYTFDKPITVRPNVPKNWMPIGVPGDIVEGAKPATGPVDWKWPLNKYSSTLSKSGGRPFLRIWIGYEDIATVHEASSEALDLSHLSIDLQFRSTIAVRGSTSQTTLEPRDGIDVVNISVGRVIRRYPITVDAENTYAMRDSRRWKAVKLKKCNITERYLNNVVEEEEFDMVE